MSFYTSFPSPGISKYATFADFPSPSSAGNGTLAVALDADILYLSTGSVWEPINSGATPGTVTSVGLALPGIFSVSGSPVTTSGTLTATLVNESANLVFAGPTSGSAAPTFRSLVAGDLPAGTGTVASVSVTTQNGVSATVANPTTTPALSFVLGAITPSSVTSVGTVSGSNLSGTNTGDQTITLTGAVTGSGTGSFSTTYSGTQGIGTGGTGQTTAPLAFGALSPLTTKGDVLGFSTLNTRIPVGSDTQVLTADSTQTLGLKWATPTTGTVTSVALADGSSTPIYTISGSPVTTSGTLTETLISQSPNTVFSGPTSGGSAQPTFRSLVSTDIPNLSATYVTQTEVGSANGVASLDSGGKVPVAQHPASVMLYKGTWNPSTNTPTLIDGTGTQGWLYWVSTAFAGPVSGLNNASMTNFQIGDVVIYNGTQWELTTPAAGVVSVNGSQGVVTVNAINQLTGDVTTSAASGSQSEVSSLVATSNATLTTLSGLTTASSLVSVGTITTGVWHGTAIDTAHGGTGSTTTQTQGAVIFAGASGVLTGDQAQFSWDDTNHYLSLGGHLSTATLGIASTGTVPAIDISTTTANTAINVQNQGAQFCAQFSNSTNSATQGAAFGGAFSRGTVNSKTAVQVGDQVCTWSGQSHNGTNFGPGYNAALAIIATENQTSTHNGGQLVIATTPNGALAPVAGLIVGQNQKIQLPSYTAGTLVSDGSGNITTTATTSGTVTSVAMTVPSFLSVSGSPVTSSGTLAVTLATETANTVFAGPTSGGAATPTFRSLVSADIPSVLTGVTSVGAAVPASSFAGVQVTGRTDGGTPGSGVIGEYQSNSGGTTPAGSTSTKTVTQITNLPAGEWDIQGQVSLGVGSIAGLLLITAEISTTNNTNDNQGEGYSQTGYPTGFVPTRDIYQLTGTRRISLSAAATIYLVSRLDYTTLGTAVFNAQSYIRARRVG